MRRALAICVLVACRRDVEQPTAVAEPPAPVEVAPTPDVEDPTTFEGRPIAPTMSFHGADWLTRPERIVEEDPDALHRALAMKPGQTACDIGAGNGYHSLRLAQAVAPNGKVFAVDIQPEMLELLRERADEAGVTNVKAVLATDDSLGLADGVCDLELLVDVYHELAHPEAAIAALHRALAKDGRLAIVEFRGEDPLVPIKPEHKMTRAQVLRELEPRGFELVAEPDGLPWQHLLVFAKATR
jgi:SAM-dependent methyltransferase